MPKVHFLTFKKQLKLQVQKRLPNEQRAPQPDGSCLLSCVINLLHSTLCAVKDETQICDANYDKSVLQVTMNLAFEAV